MSDSVREQAKDMNGAIAGKVNPDPNVDNVDAIAEKTGVEYEPEEALHTQAKLAERDRQRWQLDPDSAADH